jgi:hypothetical protein
MARRMLKLCVPVVVAALLATTLPAAATVPPTDCGRTTVKGKRYEIKTHLVSCKRGKPWARSYLRSGAKPKGYSCRNYSAKVTKFRFICRRGGRDFLAIRR